MGETDIEKRVSKVEQELAVQQTNFENMLQRISETQKQQTEQHKTFKEDNDKHHDEMISEIKKISENHQNNYTSVETTKRIFTRVETLEQKMDRWIWTALIGAISIIVSLLLSAFSAYVSFGGGK